MLTKATDLRKALKKEWAGKRVTVMGLGQFQQGSGWSSVKFFSELGAKVTVTDEKSPAHFQAAKKALQKFKPRYVFGKHELRDFTQTDLVIYNPVVQQDSPFLQAARKKNIATESDISFFVQHCPSKLTIGVTGTRGKSTTTSLIATLLQTQYANVFLGGNIGVSPLNFLFKIKENDPVVLELSSWMLESVAHLGWSPHLAVFTNIYPDHLDHYPNMQAYIQAKSLLTAFQKKGDVLIANQDNELLKIILRKAKVPVQWYSASKKGKNIYRLSQKAFLAPGSGTRTLAQLNDLQLPGQHSQMNALAAIAVADALRVPSAKISKGLRSFQGVKNRQEVIAKVKGITYINDTTATTPEAVLAALDAFPKPRVLIAGGSDKGLDFSVLAQKIKQEIAHVVLLPGPASEKLHERLRHISYTKVHGPVDTMPTAVHVANKLLTKKGSVLLSPAAASFTSFTNAYARGDAFRKAVHHLLKKH
ncbi:MAG: UDP-N-acetylmuramoyl-L-alanine--D-glutamate ligase [Candidatus Nomurabacteria bacterium]|nr:MAG: UDP-N-acetylmuramoyl-L-alanine--D-glutamate ligase [Candidatus Nomurabacteria bacterium]